MLLPDDKDELELVALTPEPPDTSCQPISESALEGPSPLLSLMMLLLPLLLLLLLLLLLFLLLLPCATSWWSMSLSTIGMWVAATVARVELWIVALGDHQRHCV